jgi:hypothetical protein
MSIGNFNEEQEKFLKIAVAIIVAMIVFPPFQQCGGTMCLSKGYGFLFSPPRHHFSVDIGTLVLQIIAVAAVAGLVIFTSRDK